jgi:hypothetical protein
MHQMLSSSKALRRVLRNSYIRPPVGFAIPSQHPLSIRSAPAEEFLMALYGSHDEDTGMPSQVQALFMSAERNFASTIGDANAFRF